LEKNPISKFYAAMNKMEQAKVAVRIDRREWSVQHDTFYYSKGIG
jgi:hypothetical protein